MLDQSTDGDDDVTGDDEKETGIAGSLCTRSKGLQKVRNRMEHLVEDDAVMQYICTYLDPFSLFRCVKAFQASSSLRNMVSFASVFVPKVVGDGDNSFEIMSVQSNIEYKLSFLQTFHHSLTKTIPQESLIRQFLDLETKGDDRKPVWGRERLKRQRRNDGAVHTAAANPTTLLHQSPSIGDNELLSIALVLQHLVLLLRNGVFRFDTAEERQNVRLIDVWHTLYALGFRSVPEFEPGFTFFDCIGRKHFATLSDMALFHHGGEAADVLYNTGTPATFSCFRGECQSCIHFLCDSAHDWTYHELVEPYMEDRRCLMDLETMDDDQVEAFLDCGEDDDGSDEEDDEEDDDDGSSHYTSYKTLVDHIGKLEYASELFPDVSTLACDHKTFQKLVNALAASNHTLISSSALCFLQKAFEDLIYPIEVLQTQVKAGNRVLQVNILVGGNGSVVARAGMDDFNVIEEDDSDDEFVPMDTL